MIYVVTHNPHYYPSSGTYDWKLVTEDLAKAIEFFEGLEVESWEEAHLVAVDPASGGSQVITVRDGEKERG